MDPIRRGAMAKMGKWLGGAAVAGAAVGRNTSATAGATMRMGGYEKVAKDMAYPAPDWSGGIPIAPEDPLRAAKQKLARPIRAKIDELNGYVSDESVSTLSGYDEGGDWYLRGMRSVQPWFKAHLRQERQKKKLDAIQLLRKQLDDIFKSPLEDLEKFLQDAVTDVVKDVVEK